MHIYRASSAPDVDSWKSLYSIAFRLSDAGEDEKAKFALEAIDNEAWRSEAFERIQKRSILTAGDFSPPPAD